LPVSDLVPERPRIGRLCATAVVLDQLSGLFDTDQEGNPTQPLAGVVDGLLREQNVSGEWVISLPQARRFILNVFEEYEMELEGVLPTPSTIGRHRRGECQCEPR
jgi:hypothetical protein